jgi:hypothetical protein
MLFLAAETGRAPERYGDHVQPGDEVSLSLKPSTYFRQEVYAPSSMIPWDLTPITKSDLRILSCGQLTAPHPASTVPHTRAVFAAACKDVPEDDTRTMVFENAATRYG